MVKKRIESMDQLNEILDNLNATKNYLSCARLPLMAMKEIAFDALRRGMAVDLQVPLRKLDSTVVMSETAICLTVDLGDKARIRSYMVPGMCLVAFISTYSPDHLHTRLVQTDRGGLIARHPHASQLYDYFGVDSHYHICADRSIHEAFYKLRKQGDMLFLIPMAIRAACTVSDPFSDITFLTRASGIKGLKL